MESTQTLAASVLAGLMFGLFAGVVGIIIRRLAARRLPLALALVIGIIGGGGTGVAATGMMRGDMHKSSLVITTGIVGALMPWVTTARFFDVHDEPEEASSRTTSPGSSPS